MLCVQQKMIFQRVLAAKNIGKRCIQVLGRNGGKKTETTPVYAHNRHPCAADIPADTEQAAIATHHHNQIAGFGQLLSGQYRSAVDVFQRSRSLIFEDDICAKRLKRGRHGHHRIADTLILAASDDGDAVKFFCHEFNLHALEAFSIWTKPPSLAPLEELFIGEDMTAMQNRFQDIITQLEEPLLSSVRQPGDLWPLMREEAKIKAAEEPILGSYFHATILNHETFGAALSFRLASKLDNPMLPTMLIRDVIGEATADDPSILAAAEVDMLATYSRDPACDDLTTPFLFFKGFHALQAYRVSHWLWQKQRKTLAQFFQNQISVTLGVDIHPAARLGSGIMFDHATGIVIGETAVVEDDVSILHAVTLGGTGKTSGDRHPKIRKGVLLAAGSKVIGNIEVGQNAKVGAGSVVLDPVPANVTVAGVPAKIVGSVHDQIPSLAMDHSIL